MLHMPKRPVHEWFWERFLSVCLTSFVSHSPELVSFLFPFRLISLHTTRAWTYHSIVVIHSSTPAFEPVSPVAT